MKNNPIVKYFLDCEPEEIVEKANDIKDITQAILRFASAMRIKMATKTIEGKSGWNCNEFFEGQQDFTWEERFIEHIEKAKKQNYSKESLVDIANFCMMKWNYEDLKSIGNGESNDPSKL